MGVIRKFPFSLKCFCFWDRVSLSASWVLGLRVCSHNQQEICNWLYNQLVINTDALRTTFWTLLICLSFVSLSCLTMGELWNLSGPDSSSLKQRNEWYFFGGSHCEPSTWEAKSGVLPLVPGQFGLYCEFQENIRNTKRDPLSKSTNRRTSKSHVS